ncbi:hypothetical protein BH09BAC1_BH09BAC1_01120 [soil metagenome]
MELDINAKGEYLSFLSKAISDAELKKRQQFLTVGQTLADMQYEVQTIINRNEEQRKITKERFNVFGCLTKHHREELHSRFIHYLLDPVASHDCGSLFLSLFIDTIKERPEIREQLAAIESTIGNAKVTREKYIGRSSSTKNYGCIDIFIGTKSFNIAIENKINAGEQLDQIKRYIGHCKELRKPFLVLYLTLNGKKSLHKHDHEYFAISYEQEIINWLDKCIKETWQFPMVHIGINYYKQMIAEQLLHKPSNKVIMDVKELLLREENKMLLNYSTELREALTNIDFELRVKFFNKLVEVLSAKYLMQCLTGTGSNIKAEEIWDYEQGTIVIAEPSLILSIKRNERIYFCIEHDSNNLYYGLFGFKHSAHLDISNNIIAQKVEQMMQQKNKLNLEQANEWWIAGRYYYLLPEISLESSRVNLLLHSKLEETVNHFVSEVEIYLQTWKDTIQEINAKST